MTRTPAEDKAIKKYDQEKVDRISFRAPKGKKKQIQDHASLRGESLNSFINRALDEAMDNDKHSI